MTADASAAHEIRCLISEQQLAQRVDELARKISADYAGKNPLLIGVLKGAWVFMADLVRRLSIPVQCDFIKLSSYGSGEISSGCVDLHLDVSMSIEGREVLIVEDIIDTGICLRWLWDHLLVKKPAEIRICALLDKPSRRITPIAVDYIGFTIDDYFVIGYGVDWNERYRELPYVGWVVSSATS